MARFGRMGVIPATLIAASIVAGCEGEPSTSNTRIGTLQYVSGSGQSGTAGLLLGQQLVVRLVDQFGAPIAGEPIVFLADTASAALGATVTPVVDTTGSDGIASTQLRLGSGATDYSILAVWRLREMIDIFGTIYPLHQVRFTAAAGAAPPVDIAILSGNNQTAAAGAVLPQPLSVLVTDNFGNPVPDVIVTFSVTSGGGQVSVPSAVTNASGVASTSWTLGAAAGLQSVAAFFSGGTPVTFSATAQ